MTKNVEMWIAKEISSKFNKAENAALVTGSGVNQPKGFIDAARLGHICATDNLYDSLVDVIHALAPAYRQGAYFILNNSTRQELYRLNGILSDTLLGYPVVISHLEPSPGACFIAFGNFRAGYIISESHETHILRDSFSNKPFVHFYATKRVGGEVVNFAAIKLLKVRD